MGATAFFQVATGLIPVLLFGGHISGTLPKPSRSPHRQGREFLFSCIAFVVIIVATFAEVNAIAGTIDPRPPDGFRLWVVAITVAGGTWLLAIAVLWEWLKPVFAEGGTPLRVLSIASIVAGIAAYSLLLESSVHLADSAVDLEPERQSTYIARSLAELDARERLTNAQERAGRISKTLADQLRVSYAQERVKSNESLTKIELLLEKGRDDLRSSP